MSELFNERLRTAREIETKKMQLADNIRLAICKYLDDFKKDTGVVVVDIRINNLDVTENGSPHRETILGEIELFYEDMFSVD